MTEAWRSADRIRLQLPRQHGAWAMLAISLAIGVAASQPAAGDAALAVAAVATYLLAATLASAAAARDRRPYQASVTFYGLGACMGSAAALAMAPGLAVALVVIVPAGTAGLLLARQRRQRSLASSLLSAVQATVLAPAAAFIGGLGDPTELARIAIVAGVYLVGSVLVVRSVIRERDNDSFTMASVTFHLVWAAAARALLAPPYALVFVGLMVRAVLVPAARRARTRRGLGIRPALIGLEETIAGIVIIVVVLVRP